MQSIEAGSRAEYRRSIGRPDDPEYSPSLAGFRELPPADTYHAVDDFTVDDDELGIANNQAAQANSALGAKRSQ